MGEQAAPNNLAEAFAASEQTTDPKLDRRHLLAGLSGLALAMASVPLRDAAAATRAIRLPRTRGLWLYNKNTDEHLRLAHVRNGFYDRNALRRLDWHLRDHHVQRYHQMNRKLFDVLYVVQQRFGADRPLLITSGYRTRSTNERLAERIPGVASNSLHISGKAVDFQIPERSPRSICNYLNDLHIGGVGRYSTHVHFDVGKVRKW
ncbi:MAG: DUF882 domain-containing protein [Alphaproteobacteria bacterium]|nr:DUF882 domain-containing protein [Alphaproteobacteria bacterium SS10]